MSDKKKVSMDNNAESEEDRHINEKKLEVTSTIEPKTKKTKSRIKKPKKTKSAEKDSENSEQVKENIVNIENAEEIIPTRPEKYVEYEERDFELIEVIPNDKEIIIGPRRLTRFEKARITGARALQLSFGAPLMINLDDKITRSSISLAIKELESRALPISIRRILPNGLYQDIPIDWMKS
ncbi:MAG: DNA-directed RNA polymerase subunit K [Nitrososphaeraceae archaeon]